MTAEREPVSLDPRMQRAIAELEEHISQRYPGTTFVVRQGIDDPEERWLVTTVDLDDPDAVIDLVIDRLLTLQIDEQVPLHVLPIHTPERLAARRLERQRQQASPFFSEPRAL